MRRGLQRVQQQQLSAHGPDVPAKVARVAHVCVHAARHERVSRPARELHHVREVVAGSKYGSLAQSLSQQHHSQPKPPKIGSHYVQPRPYRRPFNNMHNPDQDKIQAALLGIKPSRFGGL